MNSYHFFNEILPQTVGGTAQMTSQWSAHCTCPGSHLHTAPTAMNHTTAYWNGGRPWIYCYHSSCHDAVQATNLALRKRSSSTASCRFAPARTALNIARDPHWELRELARVHREAILERYHWPLAEIKHDSPCDVNGAPDIQTRQHLGLFEPDDIIWIGELNHTGKPWNRKNFRERDYWLPRVVGLARYICPAVFKPGTYSRADRNVAVRKFLVVESDTLSKDQAGAMFRLLSQRLILRAIVDSGGKSLHGWFDSPDQGELEKLEAFLPELGCDPKMFGASQPCRLAGRKRENGRWQRLVYLNTEVSSGY